MNKHIRIKSLVVAGAALLAVCLPLNAAVINWGAAQPITGESDVSTAGTLVYAFNLGLVYDGSSSVSVNGVNFLNARHQGVASQISFGNSPTSASVFNFGSGDYASLTANYQTLLQSATYKSDSGAAGTFTITLQGLTVGTEYQLQVWTNDSRNNAAARNGGTRFDGSVTLEHNTTDVGGGIGQYSLGSFVATGATQDITLTSITVSGASAQINALQLRDVSSVPEPASAALLLGLGGLATIALRRRR